MRRLALVLVTFAAGACGGGSPSSPSTVPTPTPTTTPPPNSAPAPTPAPNQVVVLRTASMRGANGHSASGTARIVREGGAHRLEFLPDFSINNGSNDLFLTRGQNLDRSRDLFVGALASRTGAQSYSLPSEASEYRYVLIWCRPFAIPIGIGELR